MRTGSITWISSVAVLMSLTVVGAHSAHSADLKNALSAAFRDLTPATVDSSILILDAPIPIPDFLETSDNFISKLQQFDAIPASTSTTSNRSIYDILRAAQDNVIVGRKRLSTTEQQSLRNAEAFLYTGADRKKTPEYLAYEKYKQQSDDLKNQLTSSDLSASERSSILSQIKTIDSDWRLFGYKLEVTQSLDVARRYGDNVTKSLLSDWSSVLEAERMFSLAQFQSAFGGKGWVRVSFTPKKFNSVVDVRIGSRSIVSTDLALVSFDYVLLNLPRRVLDHPFLVDNGWKLKGDEALSVGGAVPNKSELIPGYFSHLLIIKHLEFVFPSVIDPATISFIRSQKISNVSISGMDIDTEEHGSVLQANYLSISGPFIVGALTSRLPKSPNPEPERTWP